MSGLRTVTIAGRRVSRAAAYRVALAPHTDWFMRGARYGDVVTVGRKYLHVRLDATGKVVRLPPSAFSEAWPTGEGL